jgi:hypothetical protein
MGEKLQCTVRPLIFPRVQVRVTSDELILGLFMILESAYRNNNTFIGNLADWAIIHRQNGTCRLTRCIFGVGTSKVSADLTDLLNLNAAAAPAHVGQMPLHKPAHHLTFLSANLEL